MVLTGVIRILNVVQIMVAADTVVLIEGLVTATNLVVTIIPNIKNKPAKRSAKINAATKRNKNVTQVTKQ